MSINFPETSLFLPKREGSPLLDSGDVSLDWLLEQINLQDFRGRLLDKRLVVDIKSFLYELLHELKELGIASPCNFVYKGQKRFGVLRGLYFAIENSEVFIDFDVDDRPEFFLKKKHNFSIIDGWPIVTKEFSDRN